MKIKHGRGRCFSLYILVIRITIRNRKKKDSKGAWIGESASGEPGGIAVNQAALKFLFLYGMFVYQGDQKLCRIKAHVKQRDI